MKQLKDTLYPNQTNERREDSRNALIWYKRSDKRNNKRRPSHVLISDLWKQNEAALHNRQAYKSVTIRGEHKAALGIYNTESQTLTACKAVRETMLSALYPVTQLVYCWVNVDVKHTTISKDECGLFLTHHLPWMPNNVYTLHQILKFDDRVKTRVIQVNSWHLSPTTPSKHVNRLSSLQAKFERYYPVVTRVNWHAIQWAIHRISVTRLGSARASQSNQIAFTRRTQGSRHPLLTYQCTRASRPEAYISKYHGFLQQLDCSICCLRLCATEYTSFSWNIII